MSECVLVFWQGGSQSVLISLSRESNTNGNETFFSQIVGVKKKQVCY